MTQRLLTGACALILASCMGAGSTVSTSVPANTAPEPTESAPTSVVKDETKVVRSPLADSVVETGNAIYEPPGEQAPMPVSVSIPALSVEEVSVVGVGVLDNGDMEIPAASEVGWYRFSPSPGQDGSAVLAAHVAYNGQSGVFRHLSRIEVGDVVEIGFDDGTTRLFQVTGTAQYAKDELPAERIFAKTGDAEMALITCGGTFNRAISSYQDNIVAYAEPVG